MVIVAGGTGLLPFLDLLDLLLRKTIYDVLKSNVGEKVAEQTNVHQADFNIF